MRRRSRLAYTVWNAVYVVALVATMMPIFWDYAYGPVSWRTALFNEWEVAKARHPQLLVGVNRTRLSEPEREDLWTQPDKRGWQSCPSSLMATSTLPEKNEGYLQVFLEGGLNQQRMGICDAVAVAKLLNATLVIPHLDMNAVWQDTSMFADIFDVDYFISSLANDVRIVKELPKDFLWSTREYYATGIRSTRIKDAPAQAGHMWYHKRVLPVLQDYGIAAIAPFTHRLGFEGLPPGIQQLRCRVNFDALRFVPKIRTLGDLIVQRLHGSFQLDINKDNMINEVNKPSSVKFLALHLRFDKDMAAHSTCDFGGGVAEKRSLAKYRQVVWQGRVPNKIYTMDEIRELGKCPLTPEEVGITLAALGFHENTRLYLASYKVYGGEARMAHLRKLFPFIFDKYSLTSDAELQPFKDKSSQLAALDFHVSLHSDAFISASRGNMHNALVGHRAYMHDGMTIRPDMVLLARLFANQSCGWQEFQQLLRAGHENRMGQLVMRRPMQSIYTYPAPDCMCAPGAA